MCKEQTSWLGYHTIVLADKFSWRPRKNLGTVDASGRAGPLGYKERTELSVLLNILFFE